MSKSIMCHYPVVDMPKDLLPKRPAVPPMCLTSGNTIDCSEFLFVWNGPGSNIDELDFYYLRVLEFLAPYWKSYDYKYFQLKDIPEGRLRSEHIRH